MTVRILTGDCREVMATLPDESVHCVVTSPPYWGLRDYKVPPSVWGGDAECEHDWGKDLIHVKGGAGQNKGLTNPPDSLIRQARDNDAQTLHQGAFCRRCGAWRGVLGLEPTPDLHVEHIVEIFRHVRRVLRKDGTLWLNYGDCYADSPNGRSAADVRALGNDDRTFRDKPFGTAVGGLKPKDLVMMPARIALALQADGWWLRSEIVWAKPNPMPESITDRPTSSHEKMFLLARSARYFYDAEAVRETAINEGRVVSYDGSQKNTGHQNPTYPGASGPRDILVSGRNLRNVWHIATHPYPNAHFATFPPALVEPCIKAGTSEKGICGGCGAPWVRETNNNYVALQATNNPRSCDQNNRGAMPRVNKNVETTGWSRSCKCTLPNNILAAATVLDPFGGSGTVGLVADRLGRDAILIELNPEYADMARNRITDDAPLFAKVGT